MPTHQPKEHNRKEKGLRNEFQKPFSIFGEFENRTSWNHSQAHRAKHPASGPNFFA